MANTTYTSDTGKSYDFNTATKLNRLLVKALLSTGQLMAENTVFLLLTAMIRRSAMPLAIAARTSTSSLWAGWTQKPSD